MKCFLLSESEYFFITHASSQVPVASTSGLYLKINKKPEIYKVLAAQKSFPSRLSFCMLKSSWDFDEDFGIPMKA